MKQYIQLKTKAAFSDIMTKYNQQWGSFMWLTFRENTCYIPSENCFISLTRALELGYSSM